MATYLEQVHLAPNVEKTLASCNNAVAYELTSAADGTQLTGTGEVIVVSSDASGWLHVSASAATDKAAATKTHWIEAGIRREIGGVLKGYFVSFLAD